MINPTIVVVAFNKLYPLKRLLNSLKKAKYPPNTRIIFSVDKGGKSEVLNIVNNFRWPFGKKIVLKQEEHLGLRNHIIKCGDLTKEFDSIILLEDDLYISPMFYEYSVKALEYYQNANNIAGISLYSLSHNIFTGFPFIPIIDENDVFFLQIPASWGEVWSENQWFEFKKWYKNNNKALKPYYGFPSTVLHWPESSWAKYFWSYMVQTNKYFVYPRTSFTTQFGDTGIHTTKKTTFFQVPLQLRKKDFKFVSFENSIAIYDSFYELSPEIMKDLLDRFSDYSSFTLDLHGTKDLNEIATDYVLTSKSCKEEIFSFGKELKPVEMNIIENIEGDKIVFCKKTSIQDRKLSKLIRKQKDFLFYYKDLTKKKLLVLLLFKILKKI